MADYYLIGSPISKSLSPMIHNKLFSAKGLPWRYGLLETGEDLNVALEGLRHAKAKGFNVTIPFKEQVFSELSQITQSAAGCGAVNVVRCDSQGWVGHNTDGQGFVMGLNHRGYSVKGAQVVLLGAGGAARGIAYALMAAGAAEISVLSRRPEQAAALCEALTATASTRLTPYGLNPFSLKPQNITQNHQLKGQEGALLINTLPPSVDIAILKALLDQFPGGHVADIAYRPLETPLMQLALKQGRRAYSGLDMLFYQAALGQDFWLGHLSCSLEALLEEVTHDVAKQR